MAIGLKKVRETLNYCYGTGPFTHLLWEAPKTRRELTLGPTPWAYSFEPVKGDVVLVMRRRHDKVEREEVGQVKVTSWDATSLANDLYRAVWYDVQEEQGFDLMPGDLNTKFGERCIQELICDRAREELGLDDDDED